MVWRSSKALILRAAPGMLADEGTDAGWLTIQRQQSAGGGGGSGMPTKEDVVAKWRRLINQPLGREKKQRRTSRLDQTPSLSVPVEESHYFPRKGGQKSPLKLHHLQSSWQSSFCSCCKQEKADWFFTSCTKKGWKVTAMIKTNGNLSCVAISRKYSHLACTTSLPTIRIHLPATLMSPGAAAASLHGKSCEKKFASIWWAVPIEHVLMPRAGRADQGNALVWEI